MLQVVEVTFNKLDIRDCNYDKVQLLDGTEYDSPALGYYCSRPQSAIRSTGHTLTVAFYTDHIENHGRFSLSWKFVSKGDQG